MALITIEHVSKYYNDKGGISSKGIEDINLTFEKGEFVAITGESGSGKTTLLNAITLMDNYDEGDILFNGKSTADFTDQEIREFRKEYISFVFQDYNLFQALSPLKNIIIALRNKGYSYLEARKIAKDKLIECGLKDRLHERVIKLSGGERQRVVIARSLALNSPIIAFDEPTGNLDSKTSKEIIDLINKIKENHLILFVTHEYDLIEDIATRHITLKDGHIQNDEILKEKYLNEKSEKKIEKNNKISLKTLLYSSFQIILSSPKKVIMTCFSELLLAMAVVGIAFGFTYCSHEIDTTIQREYDSLYASITNNIPEQSMLVLNEFDNEIPDNIENAKINKESNLSFLSLYFEYIGGGYGFIEKVTPSIVQPENAQLIESKNETKPSYTLYFKDTNLSKIEKDDYLDFFSYALDTKLNGLITNNEYNNAFSDLVLNGYGVLNSGYDTKFLIVLNESAYQEIISNYDNVFKNIGYGIEGFNIPINNNFIEDHFSITLNGKEIPYFLDYGTNLMDEGFTFIQFNEIYSNYIDQIEIKLFSKTYKITEIYEVLENLIGEINTEFSGDKNDIYIDNDLEFQEGALPNCLIQVSQVQAIITYLNHKLNLVSTIYFDSISETEKYYNENKDTYHLLLGNSKIQVSTIINENNILYMVIGYSILMFVLIMFIVVVLSLTAPILNLILRKYNPDFGVMETLGFSKKSLFGIRLILIEFPLIVAYIVATSIMIPLIAINININIGHYWYIFVIFSILILLFALILCLLFFKKEKERSMREILKDAGGK